MKISRVAACLTVVCVLASLSIAATPEVKDVDSLNARVKVTADNKPLASLAAAGEVERAKGAQFLKQHEVPNFIGEGRPAYNSKNLATKAAVVQDEQGLGATSVSAGFYGADNNDNGAILGIMIAPPDTDGAVGPNHYVQMINLLTTVYNKNGGVVQASFPSNAYWSGMGGNCEPYNQGDPIVLYDDLNDRWLVSQFAFPENQSSYSQCVAVSQTGDPTGAYNRYEFSFNSIGFPDYPKHGFATDSITMTANIFDYYFEGTFLGVMDKAAMYAGQSASLLGYNIGTSQFGFVAGDFDGSGSAPALFATAMSTNNAFDIWQIDVDWSTEDTSISQLTSIPITPFDSDLCTAYREACIHQPNGGPKLEAITDRLMHRLQVRDFGTYRTMVTAHTVDVDNGRAGIRWYEFRESGGTWSLYQEGTFGPDDGEHRFMPSAAMNGAGDLGIGYLVSSTNTYVSTAAAGQSASASGSGLLDSAEAICAAGSGVQTGTNRSGDYSATSVDPLNDKFWHTNEVFTQTGSFQWNTFICEFSVGSGGGNTPPTASFTYDCDELECTFTDTSNDPDGSVTAWSWNFGDGTTSTSQSPVHTYSGDGTYTVTLTVTDNDGDDDSASQSVTVTSAPSNDPPTAAFSFNCNELDCSFTDQSTDTDGTITSWAWTFGDGGGSSAQNPSHTYASAGTFNVTLTVTDNDGATDSASQSVTVSAENQPPVASFTYTCDGLTCDFTDTSTDSDGTIVSWRWNFGDRGRSYSQNPTHTYANAGTYTVYLSVADNDGAKDYMAQSVTVPAGGSNDPPNASFTFSCNDLSCSFTDTSTDNDGTITNWNWNFGDGGGSSAQNPSHTYGSAGTYSVILTVTDNDGDNDSATQSVTVSAANNPPNASFTFSCNDLSCSFTDTSTDNDGTITNWNWNFGDGGGSSAQNPSHTYGSAGTYTATLTVTDNDGATDSASQNVTVSAGNTPPDASFTFNCNDLSCSFSDTSTDTDGTITNWNWNFGDGGGSSAQNPSHTYGSAGTYNVTLTVTDNDGDNDSATQSVTVSAANNPPNASFKFSCNDLSCSFTDTSTDTDGTITNWNWNFGDGSGSSAQNPSHTFGSAGTYSVTLTVTDNDGDNDSATQSVTVSAANNPPNASFTFSCNDLSCSFTDTSTDTDGTITNWNWNFGDGGGSSAQNPSHTYASGGTYTVTLTVTDNDGNTDSAAQSVTVSEPPSGDITLQVKGYKRWGSFYAVLYWSGATGGAVDVYRNGAKITTTANDGRHFDYIGTTPGTYTYVVCEANSSVCSNPASVNF